MRTDQDVVLRVPAPPRSVKDLTRGEALNADGVRLRMPFRALDARVLEFTL
jgi:hypothetical protein